MKNDIIKSWPIVKNVDGKQLIFMPDGTSIPAVIETTLTQGIHESNQGVGIATVKFNVQIK